MLLYFKNNRLATPLIRLCNDYCLNRYNRPIMSLDSYVIGG